MTLLDKSLRIALLGGTALVFTACPQDGADDTGKETDADTDADSDADSDADTDADSDADSDADADADTGLAIAYWVGGFEASGSDFVSGSFGWGIYGLAMGDWVCTASGTYSYEGEAPAGCPDCDWSWDLSGIENSTAVGDYCQSGDIAWADGDLDGYINYSWGFASAYEYPYNDTTLNFETNVMLYSDTSGWFVFAFNLPDYGIYQTYGDASSVQFYRMITSSSGSPYYYYYYP